MPDPIFTHPRLAAVYDTFDGPRPDLPHYVAIADELGARHVLDVGCGTGNLAALLTASGRTVTAIDPAAASLAVATRRDHRVHWIHGDATTLPDLSVDLAVLTGNVAQVFLTDDDWTATLRGIRAALRPGGHLVFETRRPAFRAWREWATEPDVTSRDVPGIGQVSQHFAVTRVALPLVSFRYTYRFPDGEVLTSDSTLRFRDEPELHEALTRTGYAVRAVRQAPDRPDREYVVIAQATD